MDERALKFRSLAEIDWETGAGDFHTELEVNQIVFLCKFPVGKGVFRKVGHLTACLFYHVVLGCLAFRHHCARGVWNGEKNLGDFVGGAFHLFLNGFVGGFEFCHLCLYAFCLVFLARLHQRSDLCGEFVEVGAVLVKTGLRRAACLVEFENLVYEFFRIEMFHRKAAHNFLWIFFDCS